MTAIQDEDVAALWATRMDARQLSPLEQRELDEWLAANERRQGSLLRAQAAIAYVDRGRALAQPAGTQITRGPLYKRRSFVAVSCVGALTLASLAELQINPGADQIHTSVGQVSRQPLADGSVATLNTKSNLTVQIKPERRVIRLHDGEAWFQVAHDSARPFVVAAGDVRVKAIGTSFAVRRRSEGADVLVTEGTVEAWVLGKEHVRTRIIAGGRSFVSNASSKIEVSFDSGEIERTLAWRSGELALDGETLAFAVAEINRYNVQKIVIDDPSLAKEPLVGYFRTHSPVGFANAVSRLVGARVIHEGPTIRLVRQDS